MMDLTRVLKARASAAYARITRTKITTAFFVFSFVHCFAQGIIQSFLFQIDAEYNTILSAVTTTAQIPTQNLTYLEGSSQDYVLRMCNDIPYGKFPCMDVYRSSVDMNSSVLDSQQRSAISQNRYAEGVVVKSTIDELSLNATGVSLTSGSNEVSLSLQCTQILLYPEQIMRNSKREDITFILLQFWLFSISLMAIMTDSIPHTLAILATRALVTAWAAYAIWRTKYIEGIFREVITQSGTPCSIDLFPAYFPTRIQYEIPDLILNCTALFIACYLSWTLLREYNDRSFKCVGAPKHINRINKFFMAVLACLQLECFVIVASMGLWIDVLVNTAIAEISAHTTIYEGLFILTTILLVPWISLGWYAIRREKKLLMWIFLGIAFFIFTGWSLMFYSIVYRWTFLQWPFMGCFVVASFILLGSTMILGVICRLNFGKGLKQYLHAEEALASSNFAPEVFSHDEEKGVPMDLDAKF